MARTDTPGRFCSVKHARQYASGVRSNRYNGGLCFDKSKGRWVIVCRDGSLMLFSRAVMAAEEDRLLQSDEIVHHVDEDPTNDDPSNLQLVTREEHIEIHREGLYV